MTNTFDPGISTPKTKYKTGEVINAITANNTITVVTVITNRAKHQITIAKYLIARSIYL
jgi:hypothetical protein